MGRELNPGVLPRIQLQDQTPVLIHSKIAAVSRDSIQKQRLAFAYVSPVDTLTIPSLRREFSYDRFRSMALQGVEPCYRVKAEVIGRDFSRSQFLCSLAPCGPCSTSSTLRFKVQLEYELKSRALSAFRVPASTLSDSLHGTQL